MSDTIGYKRRPYAGKLPERLLDELETDGGWLTTSNLASTRTYKTVLRALIRLRDRGLIESRPTGPHTGFQVEHEWRVT